MEERQREACPVILSLVYFQRNTRNSILELRLKYTCTNYYQNVLRYERVRGTLELTTPYLSHSCKVSNLKMLVHAICKYPVTIYFFYQI